MSDRLQDAQPPPETGRDAHWTCLPCALCGLCIQACDNAGLALGSECAYLAHPELCDGCGICEDVCSEGAITCEFEIIWGDGQEPRRSDSAQDTKQPTDGGNDA